MTLQFNLTVEAITKTSQPVSASEAGSIPIPAIPESTSPVSKKKKENELYQKHLTEKSQRELEWRSMHGSEKGACGKAGESEKFKQKEKESMKEGGERRDNVEKEMGKKRKRERVGKWEGERNIWKVQEKRGNGGRKKK